jgi:hypothetical protein
MKRSLAAAITVLSLAGLMLLATPAYAVGSNSTDQNMLCINSGHTSDVSTPEVVFGGVCLASGEIDRTQTLSNFNGYLRFGYVATTDALGNEYIFTADTEQNDGTTFTFVDKDVFNYLTDSTVDVRVVRTFVGNTVSWSVAVFVAGTSTPAAMPLQIYGDVGSGRHSVYRPQGPILLSFEGYGTDAFLLWKSTGVAKYSQDSSALTFDFGTASTANLQNIVVGYHTCADVPTVAALLADAAANWGTYEDTVIPAIEQGQCAEVLGTTTFTRGVPVDTILSFNDYELFDWVDGGTASIGDLPAGLDAEVLNKLSTDRSRPYIRIFGTPTTVGVLDTPVRLEDDNESDTNLSVTLTVVKEPVDAQLGLDASVGQQIGNSGASYSASGLKDGAPFTITLRSGAAMVPGQVIGQGVVTSSGRIEGVATIPAGLAAGWHSIALDSIDDTGAVISRVVYFEIDAAGQLLSSNETGAVATVDTVAALANTGFSVGAGADGALILTAAGVVLLGTALRRKHRMTRAR